MKGKNARAFSHFLTKKMKDINFASDILRHYDLDHISTPYGNGHINSTFRVYFLRDGVVKDYILQKIKK